jgi:hypothetical protein
MLYRSEKFHALLIDLLDVARVPQFLSWKSNISHCSALMIFNLLDLIGTASQLNLEDWWNCSLHFWWIFFVKCWTNDDDRWSKSQDLIFIVFEIILSSVFRLEKLVVFTLSCFLPWLSIRSIWEGLLADFESLLLFSWHFDFFCFGFEVRFEIWCKWCKYIQAHFHQ